MKIILLNGPPRSGKDAAAEMLLSAIPDSVHVKFAEPLRRALPELFGLSKDAWLDLYLNHKDEPAEELLGFSVRNRMIWLSEEVMKPVYGKDIFGHIAVNQIRALGPNTVVISDCGFPAEVVPLCEWFGEKSLLVIRLTRPGATFAGDSRNYVDMDNVESLTVPNDGSLIDLKFKLLAAVTPWLTRSN